jgi:multidrug efflux pump subunit AcrA (membrane-fusion protein)
MSEMRTLLWKISLAVVLFASCNRHAALSDDVLADSITTVLSTQTPEVVVMTLKRQSFYHDVVSNGKLVAHDYADVYFPSTDLIAEINVRNGMHVRKGQPLARLDLFKLNNTLERNRAALSQAELDLQDVLIGQGYNIKDLSSVPDDILLLAQVRSGYAKAKADLQLIQREIELATLVAPYDGVVANLDAKAHNMSKTDEPLCRIIANGMMEVEFTVLENELALMKVGDKVKVTSFANGQIHQGQITEINPLVDKNGLVKVKATVMGRDGLVDGMNVKVSVRREVKDQFVVPKTAVVLRSGRQVVFDYRDGQARWNYVTTGFENLTEYTITEGLTEGMQVIVAGNVSLAHGTFVTLKNDSL